MPGLHVAVFGAGALGGLYGVRLAARTDTRVSFVVRPSKTAVRDPIAIESARRGARESIESPDRVATVPEDADVVLLTVGTEDLDAIREPLATSRAPIVILTPMMPKDHARVRAAFGERAIAAMPSAIAYAREGIVRYWLPPAPTRIDAWWPRGDRVRLDPTRGVPALEAALRKAKMPATIEHGIDTKNPATTTCFIAIGMAVAIAGSAAKLEADDALMTLAAEACREGVRLAHRLGSPEAWASLAPALAAPWAMRAWLGVLRRASPEGLFYFEEHFGRKLREQHLLMARAIVELAEERGLPHAAFDTIARRLAT